VLIFELKCRAGHIFEGWYSGLEDLQRQLESDLIECPLCGDRKVRRVMSSFAIGGKKLSPETPENDIQKSAQAVKKAMQRFFMENFEDVGSDFFKHALKMHYGSIPLHNIRGVSSPQEEEILREEGVDFFKLSSSLMALEEETPQDLPRKSKNKSAN
jgi:hypothetical protein